MEKGRTIVLIVGKSGHGKSYLSRQLLRGSKSSHVWIFDVMGEYDFYDYTIVRNPSELYTVVVGENKPRVILRFDTIDAYEYALRLSWAVAKYYPHLLLVIEEMHNFSSPHRLNDDIEALIRFGRHRNISVMGITHRLVDIHPLVRNNVDFLICFQITNPSDLSALAALPFVGDNGAEQIARLLKTKYLMFHNE